MTSVHGSKPASIASREGTHMDLDPKYDHYDFPTIAPEKQNGHPGYTTKEQDEKVRQLRAELEKMGYTERLDTLTMLRFLRARKFDVAKTKQMFIDSEKWRKEFGTNDLLENFVYVEKPKVFEYYPQYYHKTDKDGRPLYIEHLGNVDINAMMKITTDKRMLSNLAYEYERVGEDRLPACSRKAGYLLETCCTIMDLKGVSLFSAKAVYGYLSQASNMSQNYYPERLGKLYIINAPWGFASVFSVIKSFLDPVTVNKIFVLGTGYLDELLKQVPKENLPKTLGGECECDGGCQLSDMGPWQDPEFATRTKWGRKDAQKQDGADEKDTAIKNRPAPGDDVGGEAVLVAAGEAGKAGGDEVVREGQTATA